MTTQAAPRRTWIKNPRAILSEADAGGGLVIEEDRIAELVAAGKSPGQSCQSEIDASQHVILPGLINTHSLFQYEMSLNGRDRQEADSNIK